jgi:hypothetical protein
MSSTEEKETTAIESPSDSANVVVAKDLETELVGVSNRGDEGVLEGVTIGENDENESESDEDEEVFPLPIYIS